MSETNYVKKDTFEKMKQELYLLKSVERPAASAPGLAPAAIAPGGGNSALTLLDAERVVAGMMNVDGPFENAKEESEVVRR